MTREGEGGVTQGQGGEGREGVEVKDVVTQRGEERLLHKRDDSYKREEGVVAAFKTELLEILCINPGPRAKVLVTINTVTCSTKLLPFLYSWQGRVSP